jgi:hypothetical protein
MVGRDRLRGNHRMISPIRITNSVGQSATDSISVFIPRLLSNERRHNLEDPNIARFSSYEKPVGS